MFRIASLATAEERIDASGESCMRKVREIVRLGYAGVSKHQIALRIGVAPSTVRETLKRFAARV